MDNLQIILQKNEEERLLLGHTWVYGNEVSTYIGEAKSGCVCEIYSFDKTFIGMGFFNINSKIVARIISRKKEEINEQFFEERIQKCIAYRQNLGYDNNYRVIFAESDFLPGLIVDKYDEYLSVQFLSLPLDVRRDMIIHILVKLLKPKGIYERSDVKVRLKEGLEEKTGILYGDVPDEVFILENEIKLRVDLKKGQKTGYFLDQKENRDNLKHYVRNRTVLDCFSNCGGFALNAAKNQAKEVTAVDISQKACDDILYNAKLNHFDINVLCEDVFSMLRNALKEGKKYDCIILDPPAFTKTKEKVQEAYKGYKEINLTAMKLISEGGILISCSCSHHMPGDLFLQMLTEAARDAKRNVRLLEYRQQAKDHPTVLGSDESLYLKCMVLEVQ